MREVGAPLLGSYMNDQVCMPTGLLHTHCRTKQLLAFQTCRRTKGPGHGAVSLSPDTRPAATPRFMFVAAEFCYEVNLHSSS